jgi:hypothetical protein
MQKQVVAREPKTPKPKLTTLADEKQAGSVIKDVVPATPAAFPNDRPQEVVVGMIRDLLIQRDRLDEVIVALRQLAGDPVVTAITDQQAKLVEQKNIEREADRVAAERDAAEPVKRKKEIVDKLLDSDDVEDFTSRMARLQTEAEAATFTQPPEPPKAADEGWTCPNHEQFEEATSKRRAGVTYRRCPLAECSEFERL